MHIRHVPRVKQQTFEAASKPTCSVVTAFQMLRSLVSPCSPAPNEPANKVIVVFVTKTQAAQNLRQGVRLPITDGLHATITSTALVGPAGFLA